MYLLGAQNSLHPGDGSTPYEELTHFVFALMYLLPLVGMLYAHWQGSAAARNAAILMPLSYHLASVVGVWFVFPQALNPVIAHLYVAALTHLFYAILLLALYRTAVDDDDYVYRPIK